MKVWWCLAHNSESINSLDSAEDQFACWLWADADQLEKPDGDCRMVPMRLVPADALVVEKVDGEWPKKARQKVASALGEAVGHERRNTLTVETFVRIGDFLLDNLASDIDLNVERIKDAQASQVGESGG